MTKWTNEQNEVFNFVVSGSGHAVLEAVAGSGKTSTILEACKLYKQANPLKSVRFVAFGNKIAAEIKKKLDPSLGEVSTAHSAGYKAFRKLAPKVKLLGTNQAGKFDRKNITDKFVFDGYSFDEKRALGSFVESLAEHAKNSGVVVLWEVENRAKYWELVRKFNLEFEIGSNPWVAGTQEEIEEGITLTIKTLKEHVRLAYEYMGFVDQLWFPLVFKAKFDTVDMLFVDEAQDLNVLQQIIAKQQVGTSGRIIAVGDSSQAIFGFTGSDDQSLANLRDQLSAKTLELTFCFRCPLVAIRRAQVNNPKIQAHPSAIEGSERSIRYLDLFGESFNSEDAILCRKTAPLVELAYSLIAKGIACHVEGRDIGRSLVKFVQKWKTVKTIGQLLTKLDDYATKQTEALLAKGQETQAEQLNDKVETIRVIADLLDPTDLIAVLVNKIESIFDDNAANVTLSTIHKAKGREWNRVYLLGELAYQPSKFARQAWQLRQEYNLCYVADTRTKNEWVNVAAKED